MTIIIRIKKLWIGYFVASFLTLYPIVSFSQLNADFSANRVSGCAPMTVTFQDNSTGNPTSWQWNLGNGTLTNKQNPSASYLTAGSYTVSLKISNVSGKDSITKVGFITVYDNPSADFTASNTSGCFPLKVNFSDLSKSGSGNIAVWNWDLGDGDTSLLQNPSHNYTVTGNYSITLKVINNHGCFSLNSKSQYIQVATGVTDSFTNSPATYCRPPETINFSNMTIGPAALSYEWNFGDGSISTEKDPLHTYTTAGTYSVQLITKSSAGCNDTLVKQNIITIRNFQTDFIGPDSICFTSNAIFNIKSSPAPVSSLWNLGDGTTSTLSSVTKSWNVPGVYRIKLVNNYGVCMDSVSKNISVLTPPNANFTSTDSFNCKTPFTMQFNDLTIGSTSWQWNFGDGGTSTTQNPSHTYSTAGQYDVTLIVASTLGCADTIVKKKYISVAKPKTSIVGLPGGGCIPFIYKATAITNDPKGIATYLWDFGDDTTSTLQNPVHTYYTKGIYKVKLYYTTNDGCSDSVVTNDTLKTGTPTTVDLTA